VPAAVGRHSDFTICLEHPDYPPEELQLHSLVLAARCPMLRGMLGSGMTEARSGRTAVRDVANPAAKVMMHFIYTDELPEGALIMVRCATNGLGVLHYSCVIPAQPVAVV
jgi:hypothetical protein